MKKKLLILSLLTLPLVGWSQTSLTQADIQVLGNTIMYHVVDSNAVSYENVTGSGVTWDYSTVTGYNLTKDGIVGNPDTSVYSGFYGNSDNYLFLEDFTGLFYTLDANNMNVQGYVFEDVEIPLAGTDDVALVLNANDIQALTFPFDINTPTLTDNFSGTIETLGGTLPSTPATGISYTSIDGEGTLELPGQTFNDVVRVKTVDTASASINIVFSTLNVEIRRKQYEYRHSSSKFPLFSISEVQIIDTDTQDNLANFKATLSSVAPFTAAENINAENSVSYYPNPTEGRVSLLIKSKTINIGSLEVFNSLGQNIMSKDISIKSGVNVYDIDLSLESNGIYFVKIQSGDFITTKKINKK